MKNQTIFVVIVVPSIIFRQTNVKLVTVENQPLVSLELPVLAFCRAAKADGIAIEVAVPLLFFSFGPETGCFGRRMFDCRFRQKQLIETKYLCFAWLPTEPIFRGCREVAQNGCQ